MPHKYRLYEYDVIKQEILTYIGSKQDLEEAREAAKSISVKWCEYEIPKIYMEGNKDARARTASHFEVCIGHSDFGVLILSDL